MTSVSNHSGLEAPSSYARDGMSNVRRYDTNWAARGEVRRLWFQ